MIELKRGINLGGFLSQCVHTQEHYDSFIGKEDIHIIKERGYDHVRLPIDYEVFETEDGTPIESGYDRVYDVIDWCQEEKLNIVLDLHKAYGYDFNNAGDAEKNNLFGSPALQERFISLWKSIAEHYHGYDHVVFELLNEVVEESNTEGWNDLIRRSVQAIRAIAPVTPIIYGGIMWNSATTLQYLEKPNDPNIIFTFHFYEPLLFTHQKAHWVKNMDMKTDVHYPATKADYEAGCRAIGDQGSVAMNYAGDKMDKEFMRTVMKDAIVAAKAAGQTLYCGEFGVIDQAPRADRDRWMKDVYELFDEYKIGSALWTYRKMDFEWPVD